MVQVPSLVHFAEHRVYRDVLDKTTVYVDALQPRVTAGRLDADRAPRAVPRGGRRSRPVTLELSAAQRDLATVREEMPGRTVRPLAWNSGPFFAWTRGPSGCTLLDHGVTRGGAGHSAAIRGVQPPGAELARAVASAELVQWGPLCGLSVKAEAEDGVVQAVRESARLGRAGAWDATVADALLAALEERMHRDRLRVTVAAGPLPLRAFDEVRQWVLMEWAHRLAGDIALSLPAVQVSGLVDRRPVDLGFEWRDGDRVPMRVVRSARYESLAGDSVQALGWGLAGRATRPVAARL